MFTCATVCVCVCLEIRISTVSSSVNTAENRWQGHEAHTWTFEMTRNEVQTDHKQIQLTGAFVQVELFLVFSVNIASSLCQEIKRKRRTCCKMLWMEGKG